MSTMSVSRRSFVGALPALPALRAMAQGSHTNVLFIVSDDMNNALGCYGHPIVKSPHIDRLARRGVLFERGYCQAPLCNPTRTSFMSGRRPATTQVYMNDTPTREHLGNAVFLPEQFRRHGYYTAHAGKIYHTGEGHVDPRSWDKEYPEFGKYASPEAILKHVEASGPIGHSFAWTMLKSKDAETPDGIQARRAVKLMRKAVSDSQPFFVGVGFRRPHCPYEAPKKYFDMYPPEKIPLPKMPLSHFGKLLSAAIAYDPPPKPLSDKQVREFIAAYYACMSFVDAQVGVLLAGLDELKLWNNTVVVFFSDQGYHLSDHGGLWHKLTLFEGAARVPFIVHAPGRKANGSSSPRLVELVDLYPTLTELCGLPTPKGLEGTSLVPLLDDPRRSWKKAAFTEVARGPKRGAASGEIAYIGISMRTERWRYTEWDDGERGVELYDHSRDPDELRNLARDPKYAETVRHLSKMLHAGWKAATSSAPKSS